MRLSISVPAGFRNNVRPLIGARAVNPRPSLPRFFVYQIHTMASQEQTSPESNPQAATLSSCPAANQIVQHDSKMYTTVKEGLAYILIPPDAPRQLDPKTHGSEPAQSVFYNPIQQYNRDLTVLAIRAFGEDYIARHALKRARKKQRGGKGRKKDAADGAKAYEVEGLKDGDSTGSHILAHNVQEKREMTMDNGGDEEAPSTKIQTGFDPNKAEDTKKRKLDDLGTENSEAKKTKLDPDCAEFDDNKITDEDLLAIESSMGEGLTFSTAKKTTENGQTRRKEKVTNAKGEKAASAPVEDTRPHFRILDALSATGLRALRYAKELPFVTHVTANDLSKTAVESIKLNIAHNKLEHLVRTSTGNANAHMYNFVGQESVGGPGEKYHVIDLDPYGTAVPFIDAAVQALTDNGLLCVTCTDTGVFNSMGYAEKAFSLYGGLPGKGDHCHEIGLRLILHSITTTAAKYGIAIEPLLSLSIDYYARVFVRVRKSPAEVKFHSSKTMLVYACDHGCGAWTQQFMMRALEQQSKKGTVWHKYSVSQGPTSDKLCECCGSRMHVVGPMYGGPLHNPAFIGKALDLIPKLDQETYKTLPRVEGMLSLAQEEMTLHNYDRLMVSLDAPKDAAGISKKVKSASMAHGLKQTEELEQNGNTENVDQNPADVEPKDGKISIPSKAVFESLNPAAQDHHPFYIIPSSLSRVIHCQAPPDAAFRGALKGLGFQAVRSHAHAGTIKTDAPWEAIWDVMTAWIKKNPIREESLTEGMAGYHVLKRARARAETRNEEAKTNLNGDKAHKEGKDDETPGEQKNKPWNIVFDEKLGREPPKNKRMVRYQLNPRANWGPMAKAK